MKRYCRFCGSETGASYDARCTCQFAVPEYRGKRKRLRNNGKHRSMHGVFGLKAGPR